MKYYRSWKTRGDGGGTVTHLDGLSDYTLCGLDTCGDEAIHGMPPIEIDKPKRISCKHCLEMIEIVKQHLKKD